MVFRLGDLANRGVQIDERLVERGGMVTMKRHQLIEDLGTTTLTGVTKHLLPGNDLIEDAREAASHFDARPTRVLSLRLPNRIQPAEVMVTLDEVVGDPHENGTQTPVAAADDLSIRKVHVHALITGGEEAGTSRDCLGIGIMRDRPHFSGELSGSDHIDARMREQQHVRRLHQERGNITLEGLDFQGFRGPIVIERGPDSSMDIGSVGGQGGVTGPRDNALQHTFMHAEICVPETVFQAFDARLTNQLWRWEVAAPRGSRWHFPRRHQRSRRTRAGGHPDVLESGSRATTVSPPNPVDAA